ncbi:S8 family serine peptidase [Saccharothrix sp. S26]|uniref:S8 family serine peptidase n=1 Tax=Saccharothrix sp. S26 TaxID=2907215 RepID=UPI001F469171|nr:S8 family serine peptidase [Saccharothrix sp. S26]MCE6999852.1 S8 family serine peptidase [Saccharothrix sp. S26]
MTSRSRRRGARWAAAALATGLAAGTATGVAAATPRRSDPAAGHTGPAVTLITGDKVVLNRPTSGSLRPGPGRERVTFHTFHRDGNLHVVPGDAVAAVAAGKLDLRLFDVTGLVEAGYDDSRRDSLPLIVTGDQPRSAAVQVTRALPAVGSVAATTAKSEAATTFQALVRDPGVKKVWLDGLRHPDLDRSTAQIGAPTAWQAGYTGKGVKVAVLDGGVDQTHPDLEGKEVAEHNFTDEPDATDADGHGTHVASTIASSGAKYRGVAPDARILDGKVCARYGCAESWILGGMQWAVDQGADVVNLSLGGNDSPEVDPLEEAVNTLSAQSGTLFVIAAGNSGGPGTVGSPGSADAALTVGAVDRDDDIAYFSSRGPRIGDGGVKPDITAPGVDIVAAKAASGTIGTPVDDRHVALSGTSMATPHVAGAAALLAQQHPDWNGAQLKAALMASAKANPALTAFDQGAGRVDLAKAITTTVTTDPASLSMGIRQWPHNDDTPVTRDLTYRNSGTEPVTFPVSVDAKGPDGKPAPDGMFTVTPGTVTVPAGGAAKVTVTADTRVGAVDGAYSGAVVAGDVLRTPVGIDREVESYDVKATFLDAEGGAPSSYASAVMGVDNNTFTFLQSADNTPTIRLPKGEYMVHTTILTGDEAGGRVAVLPRPSLSITGDTSVTFDARTAKPVRVTAPDPEAVSYIGDINLDRSTGDRRAGFGVAFFEGLPEHLSLGHTGPELPADNLEVTIGSQFEGRPAGDARVSYRFAWIERGRVPTGFVRAPAKRDLAEVRTRFGPGPAGDEFAHGGNASGPSGGGGWAVLFPVRPGGSAVDYVTTADVQWTWRMIQVKGEFDIVAEYASPRRAYRPGERGAESFNFPVHGPGLPASRFEPLGRVGDQLFVQVPMLNDAANNWGGSAYESARTALYREGQKIGEVADPGGSFTVPAGAARYRAEVDVVRAPGVSELSTRVTGAWTFRSDTTPEGEVRKLPISVVRFAPRLDATGGTPAGRLLRIPLTVQQQQGADNGRVRAVEVDVSFDDGKTWSAVPVVGGAALVRNAAHAGFASLRAKGADSKGNTFEHTVLRAYRLTA